MLPVYLATQTRGPPLEWPSLLPTCLDVTGNFREKSWEPKRMVWIVGWFQTPMCQNSKHDCCTLWVGSSDLFGSPSLLVHRTTFLKCSYVLTLSWTCPLSCPGLAWFPGWAFPKIAPWLSLKWHHVWTMLWGDYMYNYISDRCCEYGPLFCYLSWMGLFGHRSMKRSILFGSVSLCWIHIWSVHNCLKL